MNTIKLICFDLDKTLIKQNSWYDLNLALGVSHDEDTELYEAYHRKEFSYEEWVQKLLALYKRSDKATKGNIEDILSHYTYQAGAEETVSYLLEKGYQLALISGSNDIIVDQVARSLGIELAYSTNTFIFNEQNMLSDIQCTEESYAKLETLEEFAKKLNLRLEECACVGDGANDLPMFEKTGKGITFADSPIKGSAWQVIERLQDLQKLF